MNNIVTEGRPAFPASEIEKKSDLLISESLQVISDDAAPKKGRGRPRKDTSGSPSAQNAARPEAPGFAGSPGAPALAPKDFAPITKRILSLAERVWARQYKIPTSEFVTPEAEIKKVAEDMNEGINLLLGDLSTMFPKSVVAIISLLIVLGIHAADKYFLFLDLYEKHFGVNKTRSENVNNGQNGNREDMGGRKLNPAVISKSDSARPQARVST